MNYQKQTELHFKGRIDPGYTALYCRPEIAIRPLVLELPPGVEVALSGEWKGDPHSISIRQMAACHLGESFTLHVRNLTGHPVQGSVVVKGLSPKDKRLGRRKVVGWLQAYQQDDTA